MAARRPLEDRFWEKVDKRGPRQPHMKTRCWIWTGSRGKRGYGRINPGGKGGKGNTPLCAHRVSYEINVGEIPPGKEIDHKCVVPSCVRPSHLQAVSPRKNRQLAIERRSKRGRGFCKHGHKYTKENTYWYKNYRVCRECSRIRGRKYLSGKSLRV